VGLDVGSTGFFAIIAFYGIGKDIGFLVFHHHRFLQHR